MKGTSGYLFEVIDGVHVGKKGIAYHKDQHPEIIKVGKVLLTIDKLQILKYPSKLKFIGFVD